MRCPDCNKFVSYADPEVECNSVDVTGTEVQVEATVTLPCSDCGTELKRADVSGGGQIEHDCESDKAGLSKEELEKLTPDADYEDGTGDEQFEVVDDCPSLEGASRIQPEDRHGKRIKFGRYMKTFYGFTGEVEVKCRKCGMEFRVQVSGDEQASSFDESC